MTVTGQKRAQAALLTSKTYGKKYFPKAWVVKDSVYFTRNAARRAEEFDREPATEVTWEQAYEWQHGFPPSITLVTGKVDVNLDQRGDIFERGNLYCKNKFKAPWRR